MQKYKVVYSKESQKFLKKLDKKTKERLENAIVDYITEGIGDVKKLQGRKSEYRLRVGKYRIIFEIEGNKMTVTKIKSRGDIYKEEIENFIKHIETVLNEYKELLEKADKCIQAYAVADKDGKVKHFKGRKGTGERFKNCILYFQCKGYDEKQAQKICGMIAAKKCKAGDKYACGVK